MFDSHCHLTDERFRKDRLETIARASARGLVGAVTIASTLEDARVALELVEDHEELWSTVGVHPHEVSQASSTTLAEIRDLVSANPKVVAVGETGLDFHYNNAPKKLQKSWFSRHLQLSRELDLPVIVHSRSAEEDTIKMLEEFQGSLDFVFHCFSGSLEFLDAGLALGGYASFSGLITFSNVEMEEVVKRVPRNRLLVEKDSPYLAPVPYRGKRNEPAYLHEIIGELSRIRKEEWQEVAEVTTENAKRFYGIK